MINPLQMEILSENIDGIGKCKYPQTFECLAKNKHTTHLILKGLINIKSYEKYVKSFS